MNEKLVSAGWIEFRHDDIAIINSILGPFIKQIIPADYPGYKVARWEDAPDEVLNQLTPHWGLFTWRVDGQAH